MHPFFLISSIAFASFTTQGDPLTEKGELQADLRNPVYKNGILFTKDGGVVQSSDLRIQARSIQYVKQLGDSVHRLEAEGDLMLQYKGKIYVGSELEYDFLSKTGTIYDGRTNCSLGYLGGEKIEIQADGSYRIANAFFTTCENLDRSWDFHAKQICVIRNELLSAEQVRFHYLRTLTFWLPSFTVNLQRWFKEPLFRYSVNWDKGQGPRASIRYQLYSWKDFAFYGRVDYRWSTGWGGAIETEYLPTDRFASFVTRSYLATDFLENAPDKQFRYRLQGAFHSASRDWKTHTTLSWDKYSDVRMPGDFCNEDFEVNTAKKTLFYIHHKEQNTIAALTVQPRVNPFDSLKQQLPSVLFSVHPFELGRSKMMFNFWAKAAYLDFAYSDQLVSPKTICGTCPNPIRDFHSGRLEVRPQLYRAFHFGALTVSPRVEGIGILYTESQDHIQKALASVGYGGIAFVEARRDFQHYRHTVRPYVDYYGLTRPSVPPGEHYIFSIQDGYQTLNQIRTGIRTSLFSKKYSRCLPSFEADFYANAFLTDDTIPQLFPKLYLWLGFQFPSIAFSFHNAWNFRHRTIDFSNSRLRWTINQDAALSVDLRYRSPYDWRKADHENFILDATREEDELLLSPLSDQRLAVLFNAFVRLTPFWECNLQSHHGFLRKTQGPYNELKIDLFTWLSAHWKLCISYSHTQTDDRVTAKVFLVKKP